MRSAIVCSIWVLILALLSGCRLPRWRGASAADVALARGLTSQGLRALQAGRVEEAEKAFRAAVKKCPLDPQSHERFGDFLVTRGRLKEALDEYLAACRLAVDDPHVRLKAAEVAFQLGNIPVAEKMVSEAIDLQPTLAKAWLVRGRLYACRREFPQALWAFSRALTLAPDDHEARVELARIHRQIGEPHKALVALQAVSGGFLLGETPAPVMFELAQVYLELGRTEEAIEAALAAKAKDRNNPAYDQFLAQIKGFSPGNQIGAGAPTETPPLRFGAESVQPAAYIEALGDRAPPSVRR